MKKTTKRFPVNPDHVTALKASEAAMEAICRDFHAANPEHRGDFKLTLSVELTTDYEQYDREKGYGKKAAAEYTVGTWGYAERGQGKTFELALEEMHKKTDADGHRERAEALRREADRLDETASDLEGKDARRCGGE